MGLVPARHLAVLLATTVLSSVVATTPLAPAAEPGGDGEPAGAGTFVPSPLIDPADEVLRADPSGSTSLRPMLLVGNNWDGTVDVIDPHTLEGVGQLNVAPDFDEVVANMSPDPDQEYFGDGMAEEIINALAQVPGLRVIARTLSLIHI